jgi:hypothetical protein
MFSSPIASLMATESTRRALTEPVAEVPAPRRRAARVLHTVAVRLDHSVARTSTAAG